MSYQFVVRLVRPSNSVMFFPQDSNYNSLNTQLNTVRSSALGFIGIERVRNGNTLTITQTWDALPSMQAFQTANALLSNQVNNLRVAYYNANGISLTIVR